MQETKTYTRTVYKKSPDMCFGCDDNFYNGNNDLGVKNCWGYKSAKVVKCVIASNSTCPPFSLTQRCLSCYKKRGYIYLKNFDKIRRGQYKGMFCYAGDRSFWECK